MATQGGPATSMAIVTDGRATQGGAAIPIAIVTDGRAVQGGPALPVYVVTSGPVQGGPALPVARATAGAAGTIVANGSAVPVFIVGGGTLNPPMASLVDDFADGVRNASLWTPFVLNYSALVAVAETGGQLRITPATSTAGVLYGGYHSRIAYDLTGSQASIQCVQAASGATVDTELIIAIDDNNYLGIIKESTLIYWYANIAGVASETHATYNAGTHAWWRIRHVASDDTIRFDTSTNGLAWTQQRSMARPFAITALYANIMGGTYQSVGAPGVAIFDSFNVTP